MAETPQNRRRLRFNLRMLFVIMTLFALGCWWLAFPGRAFDADLWKDQQQVEHDVRLKMADRLVARGSLLGMTAHEVVALLGEPSIHMGSRWIGTRWHVPFHMKSHDIIYYLGNERGFMGMEKEWLVIDLGADGKVVSVKIQVG